MQSRAEFRAGVHGTHHNTGQSPPRKAALHNQMTPHPQLLPDSPSNIADTIKSQFGRKEGKERREGEKEGAMTF